MYGIIYKITNKVNGKTYVGKTTTPLKQRMASHRCADTVIGKAIRKYGGENFIVEVIEECDTKEQLNEREIFWIAALNCKTPNGYNRSDGGDGPTGYSHSEEIRAILSAANKGRKKSPEHRAKIGAGNRGKKQTPEAKAKISVAHIGKSLTTETKAKLSVIERQETSYKNLIVEMDKHQLTYTALAKLLGITKEAVSVKMRGKQNFTAEQIAKLVEIFDKPAEYLVARDDGMPFSVCKDSPFKNLLMEMDKHKITYRKLAELFGCSEGIISVKMSGRRNFTAKDIAKLVEIFGKPAEYLMQRDET
ncbi:MAG: GIY-YIG nuclease family protein [Selenomonadaceae bacterium]|nr:GIY-YIG nuclease family protein [Selenomonadaceae bacterium]